MARRRALAVFTLLLVSTGCGSCGSDSPQPAVTAPIGDTNTDAGGQASTDGGPVVDGSGSSPDADGPIVDAGAVVGCPTGTPCAVMPLGDSITYGQNTADLGGYREPLFHLAHADGKALTFVGTQQDGPATVDGVAFPRNHEGHSGYTIDDGTNEAGDVRLGISKLTVPSMKSSKPNVVLLMIGTNDVIFNMDQANAPTRLGALMDKILTADSHVLLIVAQIIPSALDNLNPGVDAYNAAIPALVQQRANAGKHVVMVDMHTPFASVASYKSTLMSDQYHPNVAGYALVAQTWYAALKPLLH